MPKREYEWTLSDAPRLRLDTSAGSVSDLLNSAAASPSSPRLLTTTAKFDALLELLHVALAFKAVDELALIYDALIHVRMCELRDHLILVLTAKGCELRSIYLSFKAV